MSQSASLASNHEMRPVSGDDLVTAALQSSLARAQKNYKLSNCKRLCNSPGKFVKKFVQEGNGEETAVSTAVKKPKAFLKFQSEFDLWIEQAQGVSFTSVGYTNGATVPEDIECLNSSSGTKTLKAQNLVKNSVLELVGLPQKNKKKLLEANLVERTAVKKEKIALAEKAVVNGGAISALKGKDKSKRGELPTENSFDLLTKFNESRKLKKQIVKAKKRLLKQGYSQEEVQKLFVKAEGYSGGAGAIIQNLKQAIIQHQKGKENKASSLSHSGNNKKLKMKDLSAENGESSASLSRPETPSAHHSNSLASTSTSSSVTPPRLIGGCSNNATSNNSPGTSNQHQLPQPKRILYPREKIIPGYQEKMPVGAGFYNMGNSCYLNASLQAVFHVPAFINWLKQDVEHRKHCSDTMNCIVCAMKKTLDSATGRGNSPPSAIRPVEIINRLRSICRHFSHGRQEDAHEFLRYLFESMERSYLTAINCLRIDNRSKETNPLGQIFGGYVRTEVTCLKCHYVSTTFQPTAELQLDIRHVTTLEDAIMNHFKKERLDNNDYKCEKCRTISQATKQFSLEIPPIVLCLQLKRFTLYGTKIAKRIHCNRTLDMSKFMHKSKQVNGFSNLKYRLVALVTHLGSSPNCGHYTAIAEAANGHFYQFDDSFVHQVTVANALNNDAYVIIYEMVKNKSCNKSPESSSTPVSSTATNNTPGYTTNATNVNYPSSTVTSSSSASSTLASLFNNKKLPTTPIPKVSSSTPSATPSSSTSSKLVQNNKLENEVKPTTNGTTSSDLSNGSSSLSGNGSYKGVELQRKMISFGIRPPSQSPRKITILKPGASLTNSSKLSQSSSSSNGISSSSSKNLASLSSPPSGAESHKSDQTIKLVPYNDDEESDKDENVRSGAGVSMPSNGNAKRLKSPENIRKQSPGKNNVYDAPITPPKSPKPSTSSVATAGPTPSTSSLAAQDRSSFTSLQKTEATASATLKSAAENTVQRDGMKRKAPSDEEAISRKSRSHRRRHSSSSSTSSNSSRSTSSSSDIKQSSNNKRKRSEELPPSKSVERKSLVVSNDRRDRESSRESQSQERDRERRRDRNPSRSRSPSVDRGNRSSSTDRRRRDNNSNGGTFDVASLRRENTVVGWEGQKSALSRSFEEDHYRKNQKSLDDDYNDDFDQGREKKARRSRSLPKDSESGVGNKFQIIEDRKRDMGHWKTFMDGSGPGFRRSGSSGGGSGSLGGTESRSWSSGDGDDASRDKRGFLPRPGSSNGSRPRHSSSNGSSHSNYSRSSHGRSPYRNGQYNGGGANHYRSQSHGSYNHNSSNHGNKHWNNDRNRH